MKNLYKPVLYYLGLVAGTIVILYNYNVINSVGGIEEKGTYAYIIYTSLKRILELTFVVGICKAVQYDISAAILLILAGMITGGCISYETLTSGGIMHMLLYSLIVAVVVLLYYIVVKILVIERSCEKENIYSKLHNSIGGYALIITILLLNIVIEVKFLKFF
jgi:hypothetical protein